MMDKNIHDMGYVGNESNNLYRLPPQGTWMIKINGNGEWKSIDRKDVPKTIQDAGEKWWEDFEDSYRADKYFCGD